MLRTECKSVFVFFLPLPLPPHFFYASSESLWGMGVWKRNMGGVFCFIWGGMGVSVQWYKWVCLMFWCPLSGKGLSVNWYRCVCEGKWVCLAPCQVVRVCLWSDRDLFGGKWGCLSVFKMGMGCLQSNTDVSEGRWACSSERKCLCEKNGCACAQVEASIPSFMDMYALPILQACQWTISIFATDKVLRQSCRTW